MAEPISNSCLRVLKKIDETDVTVGYSQPITMRSPEKAQEAMTCYRQAHPLPTWITQPADNMIVGHSSCSPFPPPFNMAFMVEAKAEMQAKSNLVVKACAATVSGNPSVSSVSGSTPTSTTTAVTTAESSTITTTSVGVGGSVLALDRLSYTTRCLEPNSATLGVQLYMSVLSNQIACYK